MTRSLVGQRRTRADEVGGYRLVCFERGVKADHQKGVCVGTPMSKIDRRFTLQL
jgi:hypothetical protein